MADLVVRCLVHRLRDGGIDAWPASFPRGVWYRPTRGNHQSIGDTNEGTDTNHESQLHGTQIPSDKTSSLQQGMLNFAGLKREIELTGKRQVFRKASADAIDLIAALLEYTPTQRLSAIHAMCHPFFDELRDPACRFPDSRHPSGTLKDLPNLFDFSRHGR